MSNADYVEILQKAVYSREKAEQLLGDSASVGRGPWAVGGTDRRVRTSIGPTKYEVRGIVW